MPFHIRDVCKDDVAMLARLHVQTFNETHRGGRADGPSFEMREHQWREAFAANDGSWFCFVVEDDDRQLVGFAKGTLHDGAVPGFAGELNKIYVLRHFHRQGIGRLLCVMWLAALSRGASIPCFSLVRRQIRRTDSTKRSELSGFTPAAVSFTADTVGAICASL
jgi:ribosomal protein S18 acetylase RimI-like enzyme